MLFRILVVSACALVSRIAHSQLIGGDPTPKVEYPAILYITNGSGLCTGTVVSPRDAKRSVILTAGHCVEDGKWVRPVSRLENYNAICRQAPEYHTSELDTDIALCLVDRSLGIEGFELSQTSPILRESVMIAGYGCTRPDLGRGASGGNDGILRMGKAPVSQLSGRDTWFYTDGRVASCSGDSGGPTFRLGTQWRLLGVTSRGNLRNLSLLADVNAPKAKKFIWSWAVEHDADICGVNVSCP